MGPTGSPAGGHSGARWMRRTGCGRIGRGVGCCYLSPDGIRHPAAGRVVAPTEPPPGATLASTSVAAPLSAAAKTNRALATAEAQRLHDLGPTPPGSVTIHGQPPKLPESAMGVPGSGSLIDVVSFWAVPMSQHDSDAWIAAHTPAGLEANFSSPGIGGPAPADIVTGTGFTAPSARAWTQATLQESVAVVDSHHSLWRVEGEAIWLDPTPVRVQPTGPTLRVTVSGACPRTDRDMVGVANQGRALDTALLPAGQPTAGRVCGYAGGNGKAFSLLTSASLESGPAADLARKVSAINVAHDSGNPVWSCGMDDGAAAVIAFSYSGRPDVDLWVKTNGCSTISNGWIVADGDPLA